MKLFNAIQVVLSIVMLVCVMIIIATSIYRGIYHPAMLVWVAIAGGVVYIIRQQIKTYKDEQE